MPIVRIPLGRRVFAPSWTMTALTVALCALFVSLGRWQWDKGIRRQAEWDEFARGADPAVALGSRAVAELARFQHVEVSGRFDPAHQFLLDNITHDDQAGYEVLTPLSLDDGRVLLIDRGWVAFSGYRSELPDVRLGASGPVRLTGRVDELPAAGLALGRTPPPPGDHWPKVTSYPDFGQLAVALGLALAGPGEGPGQPHPAAGKRLEPRIVLLDPTASFGYVRDWQPPGIEPLRNLAYAIQWWGFAATLSIIWAVLSAPKRAGSAKPPAPGKAL